MGEDRMRNAIIAGVSAVALTLSGAAFAAGGDYGGATNGQNDTSTSSGMSSGASHSMKSGSSAATGEHGQLMQVQEKLKQEGLYKGKVDGIDGQETRAALKRYQAKNGLDQTGRLDSQTAEKLGLNTEGNATEGAGSSTPPPSGSSEQSPAAGSSGNTSK